jgi:hypothetical protein
MSNRLTLLSQAEYDMVRAELKAMHDRLVEIANVIGPAYGAPWCDKALKLHRNVGHLRLQLEDRFHAGGIRHD